jgi:hypothetical protein
MHAALLCIHFFLTSKRERGINCIKRCKRNEKKKIYSLRRPISAFCTRHEKGKVFLFYFFFLLRCSSEILLFYEQERKRPLFVCLLLKFFLSYLCVKDENWNCLAHSGRLIFLVFGGCLEVKQLSVPRKKSEIF